MEGIMVQRGNTDTKYVRVWCKHDRGEFYLTHYDITDWAGIPDEKVFLQGGPKLLIKW